MMWNRAESQHPLSNAPPRGGSLAGRARSVHRLARCSLTLLAATGAVAFAAPASAQSGNTSGWDAGLAVDPPAAPGGPTGPAPGGGDPWATTPGTAGPGAAPSPSETPPASEVPSGQSQVRLVALMTDEGQRIDRGIVWRVFREADGAGALKLVATNRQPSPQLVLEPGVYLVNAAFGRANLTKTISVEPGVSSTEQFVINAGGLRLTALVGQSEAPSNSVLYDIYEGDQSQSGERTLVMSEARPGVIIRLNSGLYHIQSTYGDANAKVAADVSVEAGKLTEVALQHAAAKVTLRLVTRPGGEALPDTQWSIATPEGRLVKRSVGALPTHVLAPGAYVVTASHRGRRFEQAIQVKDGELASVEVVSR
ncbi:MAG: hypothetical protein NW205_07550 [Hyphomicrobiaceae bacterium]|nr:hypothetical protein [Hyphomicrobiaceae bacterium]